MLMLQRRFFRFLPFFIAATLIPRRHAGDARLLLLPYSYGHSLFADISPARACRRCFFISSLFDVTHAVSSAFSSSDRLLLPSRRRGDGGRRHARASHEYTARSTTAVILSASPAPPSFTYATHYSHYSLSYHAYYRHAHSVIMTLLSTCPSSTARNTIVITEYRLVIRRDIRE